MSIHKIKDSPNLDLKSPIKEFIYSFKELCQCMSIQYMLFYGNGNKMLLKLISAIICSTFWQKSQETIYLTNTSNPALYTYQQVILKVR